MRLRAYSLIVTLGILAGCERDAPPPPSLPPEILLLSGEVPNDTGPLPKELEQAEIPQDVDAMRRLREDRLAWYRASTVDAYHKHGRRNPKWDAAALDALKKVAVARANEDRSPDDYEAAFDSLHQAIELGCDDPCVLYFRAQYRYRIQLRSTPEFDYRKEITTASLALRDSNYPVTRRANAGHNYAVWTHPEPRTSEQINAALSGPDFQLVRRLFVEAISGDLEHGAENYADCMRLMMEHFSQAETGPARAFEAYRDALPEEPRFKALRHWLKGVYHQHVAWRARGTAVAAMVSRENMETFVKELMAAREEYEAAWELDPTHAEVAVGVMCTLGPIGDLEGLEFWFRRALSVDPDCVQACRIKGNFLHPKWGGHTEAVRQFASRLAGTRNWHAGLPFVGVDVLKDLPLLPTPAPRLAEVDWPVAEGVFEDFLKVHPDSRWGWTTYASAALASNKLELAVRAYDKVEGRLSPSAVPYRRFEEELRAVRDARANPKK
jgi:hypothetical protein